MAVERPLFGGAFQCQLPETWVDVSNVRQVPDNQECWLDPNTNTMIVIEIVEYQTSVSDADAVSYFLQDLAEANGAVNDIVESIEAPMVQSLPEGSRLCAGRSRQQISIGRSTSAPLMNVKIELCAIRLPRVESEILISLNSSEGPTETGFAAIVSSLRINDWSLFGHGRTGYAPPQ